MPRALVLEKAPAAKAKEPMKEPAVMSESFAEFKAETIAA
jgi:hypothetical protein